MIKVIFKVFMKSVTIFVEKETCMAVCSEETALEDVFSQWWYQSGNVRFRYICEAAYIYTYDVVSKKKKWVKLLNWKRKALWLLTSENEELIIKFNVEMNEISESTEPW
jgi:hypothetical protein